MTEVPAPTPEDMKRDPTADHARQMTGLLSARARERTWIRRAVAAEQLLLGYRKAEALWNSGMESACEDRDRLKQRVRELEAVLSAAKLSDLPSSLRMVLDVEISKVIGPVIAERDNAVRAAEANHTAKIEALAKRDELQRRLEEWRAVLEEKGLAAVPSSLRMVLEVETHKALDPILAERDSLQSAYDTEKIMAKTVVHQLQQERNRLRAENEQLRDRVHAAQQVRANLCCGVTGHLCGTDTRPLFRPCQCKFCVIWQALHDADNSDEALDSRPREGGE